jgi:kynurenine formamidase
MSSTGVDRAASTEGAGMPHPAQGLPAYRELPVRAGAPPASAWGVFGDDDQVGTVNLLTPETVRAAAQLVRTGKSFSLNWDLEQPDPPLAGRRALQHSIYRDEVGTDDYYDTFYTQRSSQWDALCHIQYPPHGFYNGCQPEEVTGRPGSRNGIDNWARRGITGRFVLADIGRARERAGRPLDQKSPEGIGADELAATLASANVSLRPGDILLLRFGWISWYESASPEDRAYAAGSALEIGTPGLAHEESVVEWLWDQHVSAVVSDNPAVEVLPIDHASLDTFLHMRIIALLGIAVGEMFQLDELAADCADDGVYEGMFVAAPLNKVGGSGSPANAIAIK